MEFTYFYNTNIGEADKKTFDYNNTSNNHDILNTLLSNNFESNYTYNGGTFNVRTQKTKLNYTLGASLQQAGLKSFIDNKSQRIVKVLLMYYRMQMLLTV